MITASQLLAHLWGDYILQSDWMAENKTKRWLPAAIHATVYSLAFLLFRPSLLAFAVILGTHLLIDRYRLARYVVWAKNYLAPEGQYLPSNVSVDGGDFPPKHIGMYANRRPFATCSATGYPAERPMWLTVWLLIIADNILHITINGLALRYL